MHCSTQGPSSRLVWVDLRCRTMAEARSRLLEVAKQEDEARTRSLVQEAIMEQLSEITGECPPLPMGCTSSRGQPIGGLPRCCRLRRPREAPSRLRYGGLPDEAAGGCPEGRGR